MLSGFPSCQHIDFAVPFASAARFTCDVLSTLLLGSPIALRMAGAKSKSKTGKGKGKAKEKGTASKLSNVNRPSSEFFLVKYG